MSGFTINAYRLTYNFQGSGIYSDTNTFSLNSNTVILFAFVLGAAFVTSAIYFWLARIFTKVSPLRLVLMVAIYLDYGDNALSSRIWHCNCLFHSEILFRCNYVPHLCCYIYCLLLLLAETDSILDTDVTIHYGRHEEISLDYRC
jgi:hypothetical protein